VSEPYLPLYVGDYLRDTGYLTLEQHGAYCMLLMRLWSAGGALPSDEGKLSRIAGVTVKKWRPIWADLADFFELENGQITHKRITSELEKAGALRAKRAAAGAKGGAAKSMKTQETPVANATAQPKQIIPDQIDRKEEPNGSSKKRGCRLPVSFEPDLGWAIDAGLSASQAQTEASQFRDYWTAKPGKDGTKLDWPATWRQWVRNQLKRRPASRASPPRQPTLADAFAEVATLSENRNDPRSDPSDESPRGAIPYLSGVQGR
jgi:uncharacterized protein YdaU (DUF1376 family)